MDNVRFFFFDILHSSQIGQYIVQYNTKFAR